MIDYFESEEVKFFRQAVRSIVDREIKPYNEEWEEKGQFPKELYKKLGEQGLLGVRIKEKYGGSGQNYSYSMALAEELCTSEAMGVVISLIMHAEIATPLIQALGSEEQKKEFLPYAVKGEKIGGLGITEPGFGSDVAQIKTTAILEKGNYVINGSKMFVTNGLSADFLIVLAQTDASKSYKGLSLFLVPTNTSGYGIGKKLQKLGNRTSDTALIFLEGVKVPQSALLGELGRGFYYIMHNFQAERLMGAALSCGMSQMMWANGLKYAKQREAFGNKLSQFQIWRHEFAQLLAEIQACRALTFQAVTLLNQGADASREVAMAKLLSCELVEKVATKMLQVHGGYGYMEEYSIARHYRDVRLMTIGGGTTEIMREIIAKMSGIDGE